MWNRVVEVVFVGALACAAGLSGELATAVTQQSPAHSEANSTSSTQGSAASSAARQKRRESIAALKQQLTVTYTRPWGAETPVGGEPQQPAATPNSAQHEPGPEAKAFVQAYAAQMPKLDHGTVETIPPSAADPQIKRFDAPNIVAYHTDVKSDAPLLVWFSGTGGTPQTGWLFIKAAADAGYRVIGLMYDNGVSDPQTCGPNPDPACADRFRQKRIFGDDISKDIDDLPAESVVNRLTQLLRYLEAREPGKGWAQYLSNGEPNWPRIAVAGHSQGGGVAAYIAKKKLVYRVINLSGAWDRTEQSRKDWAPWITSPSATPMDRWYCGYHEKETNAAPMKAAYAVMNVPPDHIRVLKLEPVPQPNLPPGGDAYHGSMISERSTPRDANGDPAYATDWAFMLGSPK